MFLYAKQISIYSDLQLSSVEASFMSDASIFYYEHILLQAVVNIMEASCVARSYLHRN